MQNAASLIFTIDLITFQIRLPLPAINASMKYFISLFFLVTFISCNETEEFQQPENALDAGREFIQYSLQGKFTTANKYMLQDEENQYWLSKWSGEFNKITEQEKASYNKASINISEVADVVKDSVTVISFSNSYRKIPQKIKVIKKSGNWLVDFKYTFSGNL